MTLRAFLIGLFGVVGLSVLTPVNDYAIGNTYLTGNHLPVGVFFFVLFLILIVNVGLKSLARRFSLRRAELLLVFCMMLVASTVPASGLMRYWFPILASPPYLAQRLDIPWEDDVLEQAPEGVLLSRKMHSTAVAQFFRGSARGEPVRVPWGAWWPVIRRWAPMILLYYLGTFFAFGLLRRQWVQNERLAFPVADVPLRLTEGTDGDRLLPAIFRNRAFLVGVVVSLAFGLMRLSPVFMGEPEGWLPNMPMQSILAGTPLDDLALEGGAIYPIAIGIAFLVGNDVSFGMWLFYLLTTIEVYALRHSALAVSSNAWSVVRWHQAGAYVAFTGCMLWMSRRHLAAVVRRAFGRGPGDADADEPISYRVGFWGVVICAAGMVAWYCQFGVSLLSAVLLLLLSFTIVLVHARLVCQGGVILTGQAWMPASVLHDVFGGTAFAGPGTVVAQAQGAIMLADAREMLSPHAMNALRISSVFERHRRLFMPVMMVALVAAMVGAGWSILRLVYYAEGGVNLANQYAISWHPLTAFSRAHEMMANPGVSARPHYVSLALGAGAMLGLHFMRTAFYWWPLSPLGLLIAASWAIKPFWFSIFLAWLTKTAILKLGTGGLLRSTRRFFLGVITAEAAMVGTCTLVSLTTGVRTGWIFLPS